MDERQTHGLDARPMPRARAPTAHAAGVRPRAEGWRRWRVSSPQRPLQQWVAFGPLGTGNRRSVRGVPRIRGPADLASVPGSAGGCRALIHDARSRVAMGAGRCEDEGAKLVPMDATNCCRKRRGKERGVPAILIRSGSRCPRYLGRTKNGDGCSWRGADATATPGKRGSIIRSEDA